MDALLCQLQFVCFLLRKTPRHYCNNSYLNKKDFVIPDMMSRPIQKPRPFSTLTHGQLHWAWLKWEL